MALSSCFLSKTSPYIEQLKFFCVGVCVHILFYYVNISFNSSILLLNPLYLLHENFYNQILAPGLSYYKIHTFLVYFICTYSICIQVIHSLLAPFRSTLLVFKPLPLDVTELNNDRVPLMCLFAKFTALRKCIDFLLPTLHSICQV